MKTTINISVPDDMYNKIKELIKEKKYASVSALVRSGVRRVFYDADKITENGLPGWREDRILETAGEHSKNEVVLETEEDILNYFKYFKKPKNKTKIKKVYDKNNVRTRVRTGISGLSSR